MQKVNVVETSFPRNVILLLRKYNKYLIPILFFGIATANWDKDYGIFPVVGLPSIIGQSQISGYEWYFLAYVFEILLVLALVLVSGRPRITLFLGVSYEAIQTLSFFLFSLEKTGDLEMPLYGIIWNDMFWLCSFPLLLTMLYFVYRPEQEGEIDHSDRSLTADL